MFFSLEWSHLVSSLANPLRFSSVTEEMGTLLLIKYSQFSLNILVVLGMVLTNESGCGEGVKKSGWGEVHIGFLHLHGKAILFLDLESQQNNSEQNGGKKRKLG